MFSDLMRREGGNLDGWVTACYAAAPVGETGGVQNLFRRFPPILR